MGTIFLTIVKGAVCVKPLLEDTEQDDACGCTKCKSHGVDPHTGKWYAYINGKKIILENHFGRMLDPEREAELDRIRHGEPLTTKQEETKRLRLERDIIYYKHHLDNIPELIEMLTKSLRKVEKELKELNHDIR